MGIVFFLGFFVCSSWIFGFHPQGLYLAANGHHAIAYIVAWEAQVSIHEPAVWRISGVWTTIFLGYSHLYLVFLFLFPMRTIQSLLWCSSRNSQFVPEATTDPEVPLPFFFF